MLALLDFTLGSRQLLHQTVVFLIASVTGRVLFPLYHAEAASCAGASVLGAWVLKLRFSMDGWVEVAKSFENYFF